MATASLEPVLKPDRELELPLQGLLQSSSLLDLSSRVPIPRGYVYQPLRNPSEIRVILLQPSSDREAPLKADIVHTSPGTEGPIHRYDALSYVWGDHSATHILETPTGNIAITASLFSALSCLRDSDEPVTIWADGVCIHQADNNEKAHQVSVMGRIYSSARRVRVFLGLETPETRTILDNMHLLREAGANFEAPTKPGVLSSVYAIFEQPWFRRVWVVQEFVLGKEVTFSWGRHQFTVEQIYEAWEALGTLMLSQGDTMGRVTTLLKDEMFVRHAATNPSVVSETQHTFCTTTQMRTKRRDAGFDPTKAPKLFYILQQLRQANLLCAISSDHMFAYLGLARDGDEEAFFPDYESPFEIVLRRYGEQMLRSEGLGLLLEAGLGARTDARSGAIPSWMPDWSQSPEFEGRLEFEQPAVWFTAGGETLESGFRHEPGSDDLILSGTFFDTIVHVGTGMATDSHPDRGFKPNLVPGDDRDTEDPNMIRSTSVSYFRRSWEPDAPLSSPPGLRDMYCHRWQERADKDKPGFIQEDKQSGNEWYFLGFTCRWLLDLKHTLSPPVYQVYPTGEGVLEVLFRTVSRDTGSTDQESDDSDTEDDDTEDEDDGGHGEDHGEQDSEERPDVKMEDDQSQNGGQNNEELTSSDTSSNQAREEVNDTNSGEQRNDSDSSAAGVAPRASTEAYKLLEDVLAVLLDPEMTARPLPETCLLLGEAEEKMIMFHSLLPNFIVDSFTPPGRTAKGYLGMLPFGTVPGDRIFVPRGGQFPIVLRESEARPGTYRHVGICYVHGIMGGEAMETCTLEEVVVY